MRPLKISAIIILFVLIGSLSIHSLNSINQDIGRHLKLGQIIWETKSVPKTNLFSFTEPDTPFINHHWLSEVVFYKLSEIVGLEGLIIFKVLIFIIAFLLIFFSVFKKTGLWPVLISTFAGIFVFMERIDVRPEIFSYLFLAIFLLALFRFKYHNESKYLYALPLIEILWVNSHIYFVLGPALVLFFLIDRFIHKKDEVRKILFLFIAVCATTIINPNLLQGALQPFTILNGYGYSIVENQSIFFLRDYGISLISINLFEFSLIILGVSFIIAFKNGARKITFESLAAIFFSILAIKMIRNFGIYAMAFVPLMALNLSTIKTPEWMRGKKFQALALTIFIFILILLVSSVINNKFYNFMETGRKFGLDVPQGAQTAVDFVKENNIQGPVFNNFDVGSFLIWKLYPEQKVFVDGRPEAYTKEFFDNIYKPMQENPEIWQKYSEEYKINYIFFAHTDITPWAQTFLRYISKQKEWPLVYYDHSIAIFLKRTPQNQTIINEFRYSQI